MAQLYKMTLYVCDLEEDLSLDEIKTLIEQDALDDVAVNCTCHFADELKNLRDKYIRGEIKFDDEYDLIDKCPTIDISPIIQKRINENMQEVKERIPTALFDKVSEELLKDQCCSTWIHCLECLVEMADAWEEINGENLVWVPGHVEGKIYTVKERVK